MRIQLVRIRNFRALRDVTIAFDDVTTFIGPNGTGKSTALRALDWFFNGKPSPLKDEDCAFGAVDDDIEVQVTFGDLNAADREALGKYTPTGVNTFTAWKKRSPDGTETMSANAKSFPAFNVIRAAGGAAERRKLYSELRTNQPELELPSASTGALVDEAMTAWESGHVERLHEAPEGLPTNFFGFNSTGKMSGLFDFVLVTADLRASEESLDGKASIIGRILERSIDRAAADESIAMIVEDSRAKQQQVYRDTFGPQLAKVRAKLDEVVARYSPGRSISVTTTEIELKPPRTSFEVAVIDGTTETKVDRQGHGFQRTLLISALQVLAESGAAASEGTICLAIEEPELFQHPIQAQAFARVLRSLAQASEKRVQVTYATHSPYFVEARSFHQVRRLVRSGSEPPEVSVHFASDGSVKGRVEGVIRPETVDKQLDAVVAGELAVALFATRALLVEGTSDVAVFYGLGDRELDGALEARGVAIVAAGSKTTIPLSHAILTELGIPTFTIFDADADGKNKSQNEQENRRLLDYFGHDDDPFPPDCVKENVAVFRDNLESFLKSEWPEWMEALRQLEDETGVPLVKNKIAYRAVTKAAGGTVPEMLHEVLATMEGMD